MFTKKIVTRATAAALLAATLAGCAVGPNYVRPETPDVALKNADVAHYDAATAPGDWWRQFDDPVLAGLVDRALAGAFDVRLAVARVDAARAAFTEARLDQLPHVTVAGDYAHSRQQQPGAGPERIETETRSAGFDARWEIDLFGRVRRQTEAARASLGAEEAGLRDAQVSVAAEVARNYFELRGAQRRLGVARDNQGNQRETLRLTQFRFDEGSGTELDVASAKARLAATEATIPQFEASEKRYAYRLAVLLGRAPGELDDELAATNATPAYVKALPIGDVANLLRRRPDVRIAERRLAAASARVGVATADLYPRISVAGFIGFLAGTGTGLGDAASKAWSVNPSVSWTGLDFGSARARLRATKADAEGALVAYEQSLVVALEDTENAFVNYGKQTSRLASLVEQAQASRRAAQLAEIQFREGGADFLLLLDAQRTLLSAEDAVAQAETDVNTGAVAVYKALGGVDDDASTVAAR